jgi:hypothetical protein
MMIMYTLLNKLWVVKYEVIRVFFNGKDDNKQS